MTEQELKTRYSTNLNDIMSPITEILAATALLMASATTAMPTLAERQVGANEFKFIASNFTLNTPQALCGTNPAPFTFGPEQFGKCTLLGNSYTRFQFEGVGSGNNENCIFFANGPECNGADQATSLFLADSPQKICLGPPITYDAILYTNDCPTGSGG